MDLRIATCVAAMATILAACARVEPLPLSTSTADAYVSPTGVCRVRIKTGLGAGFDAHFAPDARLLVVGQAACDEGMCRVVDLGDRWTMQRVGMRITAAGAVTGLAVNIGKGNEMIGALRVEPEDCRFAAPR